MRADTSPAMMSAPAPAVFFCKDRAESAHARQRRHSNRHRHITNMNFALPARNSRHAIPPQHSRAMAAFRGSHPPLIRLFTAAFTAAPPLRPLTPEQVCLRSQARRAAQCADPPAPQICGSCVTSTRVVRFRVDARAAAPARAAVLESRLPVGSSASTMGGSSMKARASATRCCSPPESCTG